MALRLPILLGVSLTLAAGWTSGIAENSPQRAKTEAQLKQIKTEIESLKQELERNRKTLSRQQKAIKSADMEIQRSAMALRELDSTRQRHDRELANLISDRDNYLGSLEERRQVLASQIMTAYRLGRESRLKLVLNQDSPARMSRTLAYYEYFSRSQAAQIGELKQVITTLDMMQEKINVELSALDDVQNNQRAILADMTSQREKRQLVVDDLSGQIDSEEKQLAELQANRKDLQLLLEKLSNALADIPDNLGQHDSAGMLKGRMQLPANGPVKHAYGQARTAGLSWQGWLIGATRGTPVKTVAHGRVAYSDWLRGYGLLMIIDHGDGIMSLYGNNESLLFEVGDWVESGSSISTVGSSPLSGDGLYFEIRKDGKAVDPAVWINR